MTSAVPPYSAFSVSSVSYVFISGVGPRQVFDFMSERLKKGLILALEGQFWRRNCHFNAGGTPHSEKGLGAGLEVSVLRVTGGKKKQEQVKSFIRSV
jgi:hypothetical protein